MDIFLITLSGLFLIIGILGSFLPILPGPPISWAGLLIATFTPYAHFSTIFLITTFIITLVLTIFDFILPGLAVKKKGGTKAGERGALAGAILGMFFGPMGIIFGPFVGALTGEMISNTGDFDKALKIALHSFWGFLLSTGLKLIWCLMMAYWFLKEVLF